MRKVPIIEHCLSALGAWFGYPSVLDGAPVEFLGSIELHILSAGWYDSENLLKAGSNLYFFDQFGTVSQIVKPMALQGIFEILDEEEFSNPFALTNNASSTSCCLVLDNSKIERKYLGNWVGDAEMVEGINGEIIA